MQPDSTILICKNIPLDNRYINTLWFANATEQKTYFSGKVKYRLEDYSYMRVNKSIRVNMICDNLYDCNYIMFTNTNYSDKIFYAFITDVTYISDECTELQYEIDVMQTWFFNYTLHQCFVEREHSATDNVGDNLVPENLETGEFIYKEISPEDYVTKLTNLTAIFANTFHTDTDYSVSKGGVVPIRTGQIVNAVEFVKVPLNSVAVYLSNVDNKGLTDGIVAAFTYPENLLTMTDSVHPSGAFNTHSYTIQRPTEIDGYTPKNNKLFTSPYTNIMIDTLQGNAANYGFEYGTGDTLKIAYNMPLQCNPELVFFPCDYKGLAFNFTEKITQTGFPQIAYLSDTYKVWLAQNSSSLSTNMIGSAFSIFAGAASAYLSNGATSAQSAQMIMGGVTGIANTLAQQSDKAKLPKQSTGASGSGTMAIAGQLYPHIYYARIRAEFARIIDDYFNVYGYATHRVKVPNTYSRPHWNYVKTQGCNITGNFPFNHARKICEIYDNGVTFWKNGGEVGNYSLDNSPA